MSRVGACWDNAVVETLFKSLKVERVYRVTYQSRTQATADLADYIDNFYNSTRRHSHADYPGKSRPSPIFSALNAFRHSISVLPLHGRRFG